MKPCLLGVVGLVGTVAAFGGDFMNLSFEDVPQNDRPHGGGGTGPASIMTPGWKTSPEGYVWFDNGAGFPGNFFLIDDWGRGLGRIWADTPLEGEVALGVLPQGPEGFPAPSISQRATVPAEARSLVFTWKGEILRVRLNDALAPIIALGPFPSSDPRLPLHNYYGVDVSAYAGRETELRFEFYTPSLSPWADYWLHQQALDGLAFLPVQIPEPGTLALGLAGGLGLLFHTAWRTRYNRRPAR